MDVNWAKAENLEPAPLQARELTIDGSFSQSRVRMRGVGDSESKSRMEKPVSVDLAVTETSVIQRYGRHEALFKHSQTILNIKVVQECF
ncbi:MAG: hypothetical protein EA414_20500 [Arthrospira sp. PLM2.Bin9]|nr:MAG: hypothetical protein EA414_20500 [Arthrospira sp. PLM2.Bin9]